MIEGEEKGGDGAAAALSPRERRALGVLVEKAKTTPEYYPMTLAAIVTACNQKSNRSPVSNYDPDDVEEVLHGLRKRGAVILVEGSGRAQRWKHTLYDWLKVGKAELAVLAELLLRGPQTEGDLRARASRMERFEDLASLQAVLDGLSARGLVHHLSPPGQKRGVFVTHGLYPPEELERVRQSYAGRAGGDEDEDGTPEGDPVRPAPSANSAARIDRAEIDELRAAIEQLRAALETIAEEVRALKSALGA